MPISTEIINQLAQNFFTAEAHHRPIEPIRSLYPALTMADGYQVQQAIVAELKAQGRQIVGKKAAATSAAAQAKMGLTEPIYGCLFDFQQAVSGQTLNAGHFIYPLIECELAFNLGQTLTGPGLTEADVLAATESIVAAFDIVDFRRPDGQVSTAEALCTNVFTAHFVLGQTALPVDRLDLPNLGITLRKNGQKVASATATMGHPARSIAWIANKLAEHHLSLEAGEVALTGAITSPQPLVSGDHFEATFDSLGLLSVQFV